jgi:asparagine N-glycosylation enzyme membrane subunit Stt3
LAISLCPAILCLAWAFLRDPRWVRYGYFTVLVLLMAVPGLTIKGALFYGFLVAMIVWFEALALRAWQLESV